ncbi:unnamed protein product [Spirodela intermedia]|uniref:Uncharacterized protein n=1 Tax=Spirodela intermedia TaxID=51605 RepID=A0ABN7EAJ9_SPIIN|nr:unnamed protein product [Spirodela intermedia]
MAPVRVLATIHLIVILRPLVIADCGSGPEALQPAHRGCFGPPCSQRCKNLGYLYGVCRGIFPRRCICYKRCPI